MQNDLDCQTCDATLKKERGCKEKGLVPFHIDTDVYWRCPITLIEPETWEYFRAYSMSKNGILPNGTGYINESEKVLQAITIIGNLYAELEKEMLENHKRKKK